jgi:hypothetical protein
MRGTLQIERELMIEINFQERRTEDRTKRRMTIEESNEAKGSTIRLITKP